MQFDKFIPDKFYILQVYEKSDHTWNNTSTSKHDDGFFLDKSQAERTARGYLGEGRDCRIVEVSDFKSDISNIDLLDSTPVIERKAKRYLKSEVRYIKKVYPDFENSLFKIRFIRVSDIKTETSLKNYNLIIKLINDCKENYVHYMMIFQVKTNSVFKSGKIILCPLASCSMSDLQYKFDLEIGQNPYFKPDVKDFRSEINTVNDKLYDWHFSNATFFSGATTVEVDKKFVSDNESEIIKSIDEVRKDVKK